ncbi:MAG: helix-turn-helix domain-containing protein [Bifidobacteriaceae bacterium]|jgi:transposase|nr:helix-turn-helix domain-containing protein [Bifidobacteriaceae bacterium]
MSSDKPKRIPQSQRNLQVRAELQPNGLGLLLAWAQAKRALDAGTPELIVKNPWRPTRPDGSDGKAVPDPESLPALTRQIVATYATGITQQQVAGKFHLHVQTVRRHLRLAGAPARNRQSPLGDAQLAEAKSLLDGGVSVRRLGILFGMAHTTIARLLRDYELRVAPRDTAGEIELGGLSIDREVFRKAFINPDPAADRIHRLAEFAREQEAASAVGDDLSREVTEQPTPNGLAGRRLLRPDLLAKRAVELDGQGWSYRRIARELGVAHSTVRKWVIHEHGGSRDWIGSGEGGAQ